MFSLRPRHLYFGFCALSAVPGRFLPLLYSAFGLSPSSIGAVYAVQVLLSNLLTPLLSHIADRSGRSRLMLVLQLGATFCLLLQTVFSGSPPAVFVLAVLNGVLAAPLDPIVRGVTIAHLISVHGATKGPLHFGAERLWGALSWGLGSLLTGIFFDFARLSVTLIATYALHVTCVALFITCALYLPSSSSLASADASIPQAHELQQQQPSTVSLAQALRAVLFPERSVVTTLLFFNTVFWFGFGVSVVETLLFLYLVQDLHASNTLCGLSVVLSVIVEIPMYALAPQMLAAISGPSVLVIAAAAYAVRVLGYALATSPLQALAFELLHGVTFATADAAFVALLATRGAEEVPGAEASVQATYSVFKAVGMASGAALGGVILESVGAQPLYLASAAVVLAAAVAFAISFKIQRRSYGYTSL